MEAVLAQRRLIAGALTAAGVPWRFVPDGTQVVVVAAWLAIQAGRYRPDPAGPQVVIFQAWLREVARRQAKNIRTAWLRREVPVAEPRGREAVDPHAMLDARDALRALDALPEHLRDVLIAVGAGHEIADYAIERGITPAAAWKRLRLGRAELSALLAGRRWRR